MSCSLYPDSEKTACGALASIRRHRTAQNTRFITLLAVASLDGLSRHPTRLFYVVLPLKTRHSDRSPKEFSAVRYAIEYDS